MVVSLLIPSQADQEVLNLSSKGGSEFASLTEIKIEHASGE